MVTARNRTVRVGDLLVRQNVLAAPKSGSFQTSSGALAGPIVAFSYPSVSVTVSLPWPDHHKNSARDHRVLLHLEEGQELREVEKDVQPTNVIELLPVTLDVTTKVSALQ